jgi:hypothetical protein
MSVEKNLFNLINWVLVLVKDFWSLTPKNRFYKALGQGLF